MKTGVKFRYIFILFMLLACSSSNKEGLTSPQSESFYPYGNPGWPNVHFDNRNSDRVNTTGTSQFTQYIRDLAGSVAAIEPTVGPDGHVCVSIGFGNAVTTQENCHLYAFDSETGSRLWCTDEINDNAIGSAPLVDKDGNVFLADNRAMNSFTPDGELRWKTPIEGFPLSAQFTPDGNLLFITHIGRIYVLKCDTGKPVMNPVVLIEGLEYSPKPMDYVSCLAAEADSECYVANTPAIDFSTGNFYFTLRKPGEEVADLVAMRYTGAPEPKIEPLWVNETLGGGSATSPTLSLDNSRIYVSDNDGDFYALDSATGSPVWDQPLHVGLTMGSCSLSDSGRILPVTMTHVMALHDDGSAARVLWDRPDIANRGVPVQTGGDIGYLIATEVNQITGLRFLVIDLESGETLKEYFLEDYEFGGTLTAIGSNGEVFTMGFISGLYGFKPL